METLFFHLETASGSELFIAPTWSGDAGDYSLLVDGHVERFAMAVDGGDVLQARILRSSGGRAISVGHALGEEIVRLPLGSLGSGASIVSMALGGRRSDFRCAVLVERGGGLELHVVTPKSKEPEVRPCALRRSSTTAAFAVAVASSRGQIVVASKDDSAVAVERFDTGSGRSLGVTTAYLHWTKELVFEREGLDLNHPRTATYLELRADPPAPATGPDPLDRFSPPADDFARPLPEIAIPLPRRGLQLAVSGTDVSFHETNIVATEQDRARIEATTVGRFDLETGSFASDRVRRQTRTVGKTPRKVDLLAITIVPHPLAVVHPAVIPAVDRGLKTVERVLRRLFEPNEAEQAYLREHPLSSLAGAALAGWALLRRGFSGDDEGDAARHATWAALMTKWLGPDEARTILANHEHGRPHDPMDEHNNEVGVFIGLHWQSMKYESIGAAVDDFLAKGYLAHKKNPDAPARWRAYLAPQTNRSTPPQHGSGYDPFHPGDMQPMPQPMPQPPQAPQMPAGGPQQTPQEQQPQQPPQRPVINGGLGGGGA